MAKRGRPRDNSVQDFSVHETPEAGLYLVRFKVSGDAFCAVVRYGVRMHKHTVETLSPYQTFCKILITKRLSRLSGKDYHLGIGNDDSIARRLTKMFRETVITRNLNRAGN